MGSGAGEGTKPSNSLIRATVAEFTLGPVHCLGVRGVARDVLAKRASEVREKCMVVVDR